MSHLLWVHTTEPLCFWACVSEGEGCFSAIFSGLVCFCLDKIGPPVTIIIYLCINISYVYIYFCIHVYLNMYSCLYKGGYFIGQVKCMNFLHIRVLVFLPYAAKSSWEIQYRGKKGQAYIAQLYSIRTCKPSLLLFCAFVCVCTECAHALYWAFLFSGGNKNCKWLFMTIYSNLQSWEVFNFEDI